LTADNSALMIKGKSKPFVCLFVCLFVCMFVYSHTSNFSAIWWQSPLPVTGLQI
jgi:hypothetical protein